MDKDLKEMLMEMALKDGLAEAKEMAEKLRIDFDWPSVEQQVSGKGYIGDYKRGRSKNHRLMYFIPGAELENGLTLPGFACHPEMAESAAKELLRLVADRRKNRQG